MPKRKATTKTEDSPKKSKTQSTIKKESPKVVKEKGSNDKKKSHPKLIDEATNEELEVKFE